jgi:flagellar basal body P-ring protein FlgI
LPFFGKIACRPVICCINQKQVDIAKFIVPDRNDIRSIGQNDIAKIIVPDRNDICSIGLNIKVKLLIVSIQNNNLAILSNCQKKQNDNKKLYRC